LLSFKKSNFPDGFLIRLGSSQHGLKCLDSFIRLAADYKVDDDLMMTPLSS